MNGIISVTPAFCRALATLPSQTREYGDDDYSALRVHCRPSYRAYSSFTGVVFEHHQKKFGKHQIILSSSRVLVCACVMCVFWEPHTGDFGLDPLKLTDNADKKARYELSEIVHCRLAMFAISGILTQSVLSGGQFPYLVPY